MRVVITGARRVRGTITVPGDKSISHRALLIGAIAEGITTIEGCLIADDVLRTKACLEALGVRIEGLDATIANEAINALVRVHGVAGARFQRPSNMLDAGNSGTTMRLLLGLLAAHPFTTTITGDESLRRRPMDRIAIPLSQMGAHIEGDGERCYPPVTICGGRLRAITYDMPIASAQVKSAIMLAGLFADGTTVIKQPALSRDHTERMLCVFGAEVSVEGMIISVRGGAKLRAQHLRIPGDISSAAFFLAASAAMPKSQVTVTRVGVNPTRTGMLDALRMMGVDVEISNEREECGEPVADITVCGVKRLRGIALNGPIIPRMIDELPLIAVLCAVADGESEIRDAAELRLKECDRIKAMAEGLRKMGACIDELPDGWRISGVSQLHGAHVDSYRDHRIAMALAIAGLLADGETVIDGAECVSISFPKFWATLEQLRS